MARTFTNANDQTLVKWIKGARKRLIVVAPALTAKVADALLTHVRACRTIATTVVIDSDENIYRLGYGDKKGLKLLQNAIEKKHLPVQKQKGVRIGLVVSDDKTIVYSPTPQNFEQGLTKEDEPNALIIGGAATETIAMATASKKAVNVESTSKGPGSKSTIVGEFPTNSNSTTDDEESDSTDEPSVKGEGKAEIGNEEMKADELKQTQEALEANPPVPYDINKIIQVFSSHVQYVELEIRNAQFSKRRTQLPKHLQAFKTNEMRAKVNSSLTIPLDLEKLVSVKTSTSGESIQVNEKGLTGQRRTIQNKYLKKWSGRGSVILRRDKAAFEKEINQLIDLAEKYHKCLDEDMEEAKRGFQKQLVDEFLDDWMTEPPKELSRLHYLVEVASEVASEDVRKKIYARYLECEAQKLFDKVVTKVQKPEKKLLFKDITVEDLSDPNVMGELKDILLAQGVEEEEMKNLVIDWNAVGKR